MRIDENGQLSLFWETTYNDGFFEWWLFKYWNDYVETRRNYTPVTNGE